MFKKDPLPHRRGLPKAICEKEIEVPNPCFYVEKRRKASETDAECVPTKTQFTCPEVKAFKKPVKKIVPKIYTPKEVKLNIVEPILPTEDAAIGNDEISVSCAEIMVEEGVGPIGDTIIVVENTFYAATKEEANELARQAAIDSMSCCWGNEEVVYACEETDVTEGEFTLTYVDTEEVEQNITIDDADKNYGNAIVTPAVTHGIIAIDFDANSIYIAGNYVSDTTIEIINSSTNNGIYTVTYQAYEAGQDRTILTLEEPLTTQTVDGEVVYEEAILTNIVWVSPTLLIIDLQGDYTTIFTNGRYIEVVNHWDNNGIYEVNSSYYAYASNLDLWVTVIHLMEETPVNSRDKLIYDSENDIIFGELPAYFQSTGSTTIPANYVINCESQANANAEALALAEANTICEYKNRRMRKFCPPDFEPSEFTIEEGEFTLPAQDGFTPEENQTAVDNLALQALMDQECITLFLPCPTGYEFTSDITVNPSNTGEVQKGSSTIELVPRDDGCGAKLEGEISFPDLPCPTGTTFDTNITVDQSNTNQSEKGSTTLEIVKNDDDCGATLQGIIRFPDLPCPTGISVQNNITLVNKVDAGDSISLSEPDDCTVRLNGQITMPPCPTGVSVENNITLVNKTDPSDSISLSEPDDCTVRLNGQITMPEIPRIHLRVLRGFCCKWVAITPITCNSDIQIVAEYRCYYERNRCDVGPNNETQPYYDLAGYAGSGSESNCIDCYYRIQMLGLKTIVSGTSGIYFLYVAAPFAALAWTGSCNLLTNEAYSSTSGVTNFVRNGPCDECTLWGATPGIDPLGTYF